MKARKKLSTYHGLNRTITTTNFAAYLGCTPKKLLFMKGYFVFGYEKEYWVVDPGSARKEYRWHLGRCLARLQKVYKESNLLPSQR